MVKSFQKGKKLDQSDTLGYCSLPTNFLEIEKKNYLLWTTSGCTYDVYLPFAGFHINNLATKILFFWLTSCKHVSWQN